MGGSQADMLQAIFIKMNKQKMDMDNNMAMQLDNFKRELQGATSSVSSEVKKLKAEHTNVWKHPGNKDQFDHSKCFFHNKIREHYQSSNAGIILPVTFVEPELAKRN